jgi:predicted PurR-regulated permease PerM
MTDKTSQSGAPDAVKVEINADVAEVYAVPPPVSATQNEFSVPPASTGVYPAEWSLWTKRVAAIILFAAGLYSLTFLGPVLQILIVALLLSLIFLPPIIFLTRRVRLPYVVSVLLVFVIYLIVVGFILVRLGPVISATTDQWQVPVSNTINTVIAFFRDYTREQGVITLSQFPEQTVNLNFILEPISRLFKGETSQVVQQLQSIDVSSIIGIVAGAAGSLLNAISTLLFGHFVALLILLEFPAVYRSFVRLDDNFEREYAILIRRIYRVWTGFFRGQVLISLIVGAATWLQLELMGVPGALAVGIFAGILSVIPTIGSLIGLIPIALAALIGGSTAFPELARGTLALLAVGLNLLLIQSVIFNVIGPKIMGDAVALPLPVIIVGLFIGTAFGGVIGALLIAPILGTARIIVDYVIKKIRGGDPFPGEERPQMVLDILFGERVALPPPPPGPEVRRPEGAPSGLSS